MTGRDQPLLPFASTFPWMQSTASPSARGAHYLSLMYQWERSQWASQSDWQRRSLSQRHYLLRAAFTHSPYYQVALGGVNYDPGIPLTEDIWVRLPTLKRRDIQTHADELKCRAVPKGQEDVKTVTSSGSTGTPIKVLLPQPKGTIWAAATVFEHVLHNRDFMKKAAAVRVRKEKDVGPEGRNMPDWGAPFTQVFKTGPATIFDIHEDPERMANWLIRENPAYLLVFPSTLEALLPILKSKGAELPGLDHFRTLSEQLPPTLREDVDRQFGRKIVDMYSAQEIGYMALQCPESDHYHLFQDVCFTEILRDDGTPCGPGEIGRVVVTDPFNLVFPLIRYDIGDYAEVGELCGCGRRHPVLKRIMGRVRNLVTLPDGSRHWPMTASKKLREIGGVSQFQLIQTALEKIQAKVVCDSPLDNGQKAQMIKTIQDRLGFPFEVSVEEVADIPRGANGKFEEFKSEIMPESPIEAFGGKHGS